MFNAIQILHCTGAPVWFPSLNFDHMEWSVLHARNLRPTVYSMRLFLWRCWRRFSSLPAYDTVFTDIYRRFCWLFDPEDRGRKIFQKAGEYLLIYMASYPRRLKSSLVFLINVTNHFEELRKLRVTAGRYGPLLCIYGDAIRWTEWWKNLTSRGILIVQFVLQTLKINNFRCK